MTPDMCRTMARYNRWMNEKLYAVAASLPDEERRRDRGAFFKSIHNTLDHILNGDRIWLARFTGKLAKNMTPEALYPDFQELLHERAQTDDEILGWAGWLTVDQIATNIAYVRRNVAYDEPLAGLAMHFFNHQTHHRGQVTTLYAQMGIDCGVTDLVAMLREEAAVAAARIGTQR